MRTTSRYEKQGDYTIDRTSEGYKVVLSKGRFQGTVTIPYSHKFPKSMDWSQNMFTDDPEFHEKLVEKAYKILKSKADANSPGLSKAESFIKQISEDADYLEKAYGFKTKEELIDYLKNDKDWQKAFKEEGIFGYSLVPSAKFPMTLIGKKGLLTLGKRGDELVGITSTAVFPL